MHKSQPCAAWPRGGPSPPKSSDWYRPLQHSTAHISHAGGYFRQVAVVGIGPNSQDSGLGNWNFLECLCGGIKPWVG